MLTTSRGFHSELLTGAGGTSGSLVTDDVGETITDRPPRPPRDSGRSPCRDDLAGRAPLGDDVDAFDDDPFDRARSSPDRTRSSDEGSSDGGV